MPIEQLSPQAFLDERLASLEDPDLAQRLFTEHADLYGEEPPQTERQVLAWATRRFGTVVLAVTATLSIAAGYVLAPNYLRHDAAPAAKPAAAVVAPAPPRAPRDLKRHAVTPAPAKRAAAHATHPSATTHVAAAVPTQAAAVPRAIHAHAVAPALPHPVVYTHPARVHVVAPAPVPSRETVALRAKLHAQALELAALRKKAAAEDAALRAAARPHSAPRTQPAPHVQPRTETAAPTATTTATAAQTGTDVVTGASEPMPASPNAGVKAPPPSNPGGGWNEHPPMSGTYGIPSGGVVFGGPADPCTPRGGRTGVVQQILTRAVVGAIAGH